MYHYVGPILRRSFHSGSFLLKDTKVFGKVQTMPVPQALRYLRAIEAGQPLSQQTITVQLLVNGAKGNAPLNGDISMHKLVQKQRIAVFTNNEEQKNIAQELGIDVIGGSDLIRRIASDEQKIDFHRAFATPEMVQELHSIAPKLGRRKVLPQLKKHTVGPDIRSLVQDKLYMMPFKQKNKFISFGVGKCNFTDEEILKNLIKVAEGVKEAVKNQTNKKGSSIIKCVLSTTHGPGIPIDLL